MQKLLVVLLCALVAFAASADVSAEVETGVASLNADFAAEVQSAIDSDHETTEESTEAEVEAEEDAEEAEEAAEPVFLQGEADSEVDAEAEELEADLAELDEMETEVDAAEEGELAIDNNESVEELETELADVEAQCNTMEEAADSHESESFIEQYDEVAADTQMEAIPASGDDMRMAQQQGFFKEAGKVLGKAAIAGAKAAGKEIGKGLVKAGKAVIKKAVKLVKKVAGKVKNSKLGKATGKLLKKAGKLAKKAIKAGKKIIKKLLGKKHHKKHHHHKKHKKHEKKGKKVQCADGTSSKKGGIQGACSHHGGICKKPQGCKKFKKGVKRSRPSKKALKKLCKKGPAGKACRDNFKCAIGKAGRKCRKARCKAHRLGCRYACRRGGWSTRRHHKSLACLSMGGVMEPQPDTMTDALESQLDISQGVMTEDGAVGPNAHGQPNQPDMGTAAGAVDSQGRPLIDSETGRANPRAGSVAGGRAYDARDEEDRENLPKSGKGMWNGVDPKYHGQPDLPSVPRLPEDVEDCVACQYVWKQVEQDVGNSAITQTIYDSFHANAIDAQRTPVFYPAVQTMFDAADDMIGDYMEGFTVNQLCENSMLCRPRDLRQFLKHQRVTKGI